MAQMALTVAGSVIGGYFGGPYGAMAGAALGGMAGGLIDQQLFGAKAPKQVGPRLSDLLVQNASYGQPIARAWGQVAFAGNLIWARPLREVRTTKTQSSGGKGGGPSSQSVTYSYYGNFAVGVCEGPIAQFGRIWADGKLMRDAGGAGKYGGYMTFYTGTETQAADPTIQSYEGVGATPAFKGLAYIVFTDLPLADWGNRVPSLKVEVVTKAGASATFDSDFVAKSTYLADTDWGGSGTSFMKNGGHSTDKFGNYIINNEVFGNRAVAISPAGAHVWTLDNSDMADLVEDRIGAGYIVRDLGGTPDGWLDRGFVTPIVGGEYLLMTFQAGPSPTTGGGIQQWVAILDPVASGVPTVLGVVRYKHGTSGGIPGVMQRNVMLCGAQTEFEPMFLQGWKAGQAGYYYGLVLLPSVDELINSAYAIGYGSSIYGWELFEIPCLEYWPLGGDDFSRNLYHAYSFVDNANPNTVAGFTLPLLDPSNPSQPQYKTGLYYYFNKAYVQWCLANNVFLGANPEVLNVLGPAHPNGCVVRIEFPALTFAGVAFANVGLGIAAHKAVITTPTYIVDDANWQLAAGGSALPFTDEYRYMSDDTAGGTDHYSPQPALIEQQADGTFLVAFAMLGKSDMIHRSDYTLQWVALRTFLYSPATGVATQIARLAGPIYSAADMGESSIDPTNENCALTAQHEGSTVYLWGDVIDHYTYFVKFGTISLTGDIGLDEIVGDVCNLCDLVAATDYDATPLATERVRGYVVGREADARAAIEPLQAAFFFDGVESDGKVKWKFRGGSAIASIAEADLGARSGGDAVPKVRETRRQDFELPRTVIIRYMDPDRDFQAGAQQAKRIAATMGSRDQQTIDAPLVLNKTEAVQIAQKGIYLAWLMRTSYAFSLPLDYVRYDPADVLTLTWGDGTVSAPVYLTELAFGADNVLEAKGLGADDVVYLDSPSTGAGSVFIGQTVGAIEAATLALMDLPPLRDADDDFGFYFAMAGRSDDWHGGTLYRSLDGVTYEAIATADAPTPMGHATTVLAAGPTTIHDDSNTVTVQLTYGALSSVTRAQSLNGANAALLGNEILTFDAATLVSAGVYTLSGLMRGRKGTEWAVSTHLLGERFVLLSAGTIGRVADLASNRNVAVHYKAVSNGLAVASAADNLFTDTAASLKPYLPVQIVGSRDGSSNLTITWVRRARLYAEWTDGVDVPLDEPSESYEVDVLDGGGAVVRTITGLSTPQATYSAANQVADGFAPGEAISGNVYQMSSRVGRGFAGAWTAEATTGDMLLDGGGPSDAGVILDGGGPSDAGVILDGGTV